MTDIPNTLGVPATADQVVEVTDIDQLRGVLRSAPDALVLGGGSNVVLGRHLQQTVVLMCNRGISVAADGETVEVTAAAGEGWHRLVRHCLDCGYFGLENLALIPGSVGAAPLQNIGAYGVELAQRLVRLRALRVSDGSVRAFDASECGFGYRDSWFKSAGAGQYVILDVTLRLSTQPQLVLDYPDILAELSRMGVKRIRPQDVARAVIRVRRRKLPDPAKVGNVGSFFKNPVVSRDVAQHVQSLGEGLSAHAAEPAGMVKLSAAQLIDQAAGKLETHGGAAVWPRQPLVLINQGNATGSDFVALAEKIQAKVMARFGVPLVLEPRTYGL